MIIEPNITRTAHFGNLSFPTRQDYVDYFITKGIVKTEDEIWNNNSYLSLIHRHWHGEGRNGCIFALLAARKADEVGWLDFPVTGSITEIEKGTFDNFILHEISAAIENPKCEVLSLLFSNIVSDEDLVRLIKHLIQIKSMILVNQQVIEDWILLALRIQLEKGDVLSWLMAFGPFIYFPQTRQSPITEIAIRTKPKPEKQFHRLSKEKDAAHLADLPLEYSEKIMEKTWENTERRTRLILGEEPNEFSAAKNTLTLPNKYW